MSIILDCEQPRLRWLVFTGEHIFWTKFLRYGILTYNGTAKELETLSKHKDQDGEIRDGIRKSNPARSALEAKGITALTELAKYSEREILKLHGMGPRSIPTLTQALMDAGLSFKDAQTGKS